MTRATSIPRTALIFTAFLAITLVLAGGAQAGEPLAAGAAPGEAGAVTESRGGGGAGADQALAPSSAAVDPELMDNNLDFLDEENGGGSASNGVADPLEPINRAIFKFNDKLYFWVLKPVAKGYNKIAPEPVRKGVSNFFRNLAFPVRFVNCALQGKGAAAEGEFARFFANSTFGLLGIIDVGEKHPELAPPPSEDTGQTLGKWGLGNGCYLVLPFLGPSTARDAFGTAVDRVFLTPSAYVEPIEASLGISAYEKLNDVSLSLGDYETLKDAAFDPYISARDAYMQYRKVQIKK